MERLMKIDLAWTGVAHRSDGVASELAGMTLSALGHDWIGNRASHVRMLPGICEG